MKAKRLVALLAVVMLIVGVFALPASAAMKCKYCPSLNVRQDAYNTTYYSKVETCPYYKSVHNHKVYKVFLTYDCSNGHHWEEEKVSDRNITCPYQ